ncbi:MAG: hypothetical protein J2P50_08015 [Hyphomicrobiaceae bacterium]|nr:hypothetical protein [Hyphomicrobiaceae bacterium]
MFIWLPPTEAPDSRPVPDEEPENPPSAPNSSVLPDSVPSRAIREFVGMPLRWVQPKWLRRTYELRCGEEILARMPYDDPLWRDEPRGLARTKEGAWSFRGYGTEVTIETDKGDRMLVRGYGGWTGRFTRFHNPTLSLPNGHDYFLKRWGSLHDYFLKRWGWSLTAYYRWLAADGTALVTFSVRPWPQGYMMKIGMKISGQVEVRPPAAALPELDLLITLGLYLARTPAFHMSGG